MPEDFFIGLRADSLFSKGLKLVEKLGIKTYKIL